MMNRALHARLAKLEQRMPTDDTLVITVTHRAADDHGPETPAGTVIAERMVVLTRARRGSWRPLTPGPLPDDR